MCSNDERFRRIFSNVDNHFVGSMEHVYSYQKKYARFFKGAPGLIVDLGCGQGAFLRALAEEGFNYLGVDSDPQNIALCQLNGLVATLSDGATFLRQHEQSLGGIFMAHVIEHYPGPEALRLLVQCYDALLPKGILIVITPDFKAEPIHAEQFWLSTSHVRPYPVDWLRCAFGEIGFKIVDSGNDSDFGDVFIVGIKS